MTATHHNDQGTSKITLSIETGSEYAVKMYGNPGTQWHTTVISVLLRWRQEDHEFKANWDTLPTK